MSDDDRRKAWGAVHDGLAEAVHRGYLDSPEGRASLAKLMILPLVPRWVKAPETARCTSCGAGDLDRSVILAGSPFSGSVRCPSCGHTESVCSHLGKTCIVVEPLEPT